MNQYLLDSCPNKKESLLQQHQSRSHGVLIDDCSVQHRQINGSSGTQCVQVLETKLPVEFDGLKCLVKLEKPSEADIATYPRIEITYPMPYNPKQIYTRRRHTKVSPDMDDWRKNLGYPTEEVTKRTVENTTQYVSSVEAESREYMRDHRKSRLMAL